MSGFTVKETEALCSGREVSGVWKGPQHPGRAVLLWDHPRMVCSLQEDPDLDALSDLWFLLLDQKGSRK